LYLKNHDALSFVRDNAWPFSCMSQDASPLFFKHRGAAFKSSISHYHAEDSAMKKTTLLAGKGSVAACTICLSLTLVIPITIVETKAGENSRQHPPANQPIAAKDASAGEAKIVSNILLSALEEKLKSMREQIRQAQERSVADSGASAAPVIAFINQRIAALERMMVLIEQRQVMQAAVDAYKKRLHDLQQKISAGKTTSLE
jgi:hypothetical protein